MTEQERRQLDQEGYVVCSSSSKAPHSPTGSPKNPYRSTKRYASRGRPPKPSKPPTSKGSFIAI